MGLWIVCFCILGCLLVLYLVWIIRFGFDVDWLLWVYVDFGGFVDLLVLDAIVCLILVGVFSGCWVCTWFDLFLNLVTCCSLRILVKLFWLLIWLLVVLVVYCFVLCFYLICFHLIFGCLYFIACCVCLFVYLFCVNRYFDGGFDGVQCCWEAVVIALYLGLRGFWYFDLFCLIWFWLILVWWFGWALCFVLILDFALIVGVFVWCF